MHASPKLVNHNTAAIARERALKPVLVDAAGANSLVSGYGRIVAYVFWLPFVASQVVAKGIKHLPQIGNGCGVLLF